MLCEAVCIEPADWTLPMHVATDSGSSTCHWWLFSGGSAALH